MGFVAVEGARAVTATRESSEDTDRGQKILWSLGVVEVEVLETRLIYHTRAQDLGIHKLDIVMMAVRMVGLRR